MNKKDNTMPLVGYRIAKMLILVKDVAIVPLEGGVIWPIGTFQGGTLVKSRDGKYRLNGAYVPSEDMEYDSIELPPEAVAAAMVGDLDDDEHGFDSIELRISATEYKYLNVHPQEWDWWSMAMLEKVLKLNDLELNK